MSLVVLLFGYNDTGQSDYPRNVVNLNQTLDSPNDDDVRTFVGSACVRGSA